MRYLFLIMTLFSLIFVRNFHSQSNLIWSSDFSTSLNNSFSECPNIHTKNDTIKVIGIKNTENGQRLLIVKYDINGNILTNNIYGNDSVFDNLILDYKFDSLNHIYILNKEKLGFYKSKIVLQKYDIDGTLQWVEQIQNSTDTSYIPHSICLSKDTCIFITVYKEYDYPEQNGDVINTISLSQLYLYNSNGNQLWKREFNPNTEIYHFQNKIFVHNNFAYLFANSMTLGGCLIKVDLNNNITINSNTGLIDGIENIQLTSDNKLLITSKTNYRISKVNLMGSLVWTKLFDTNLPNNISGDEIKSTILDSSGNIYITGKHYGLNYGTSNFTNADILTIKYNSNGNLIWQNRYEYLVNNADIGNTIKLKNGNIYIGGESQELGSNYDYIILKMNAETGVLTGEYRYGGLENGDDAVSSLYIFDNGNLALTGLSFNNSQFDWTTQMLSDVVLSIPNQFIDNNFKIYPNPSNNIFNIEIKENNSDILNLEITNQLGEIVKIIHSPQKVKENSFEINCSELNTGIYFVYVYENDKKYTFKLIKN